MEKVMLTNQWELAELLKKFPQLDDGILQYPKLPMEIGTWYSPVDSSWTGSCTNGYNKIAVLVYIRGEWNELTPEKYFHSNYSDDSNYRVPAKPLMEQILDKHPEEDVLLFGTDTYVDNTVGQDLVNETKCFLDIITMEELLHYQDEKIEEAKKKIKKLEKANFCIRAKIG